MSCGGNQGLGELGVGALLGTHPGIERVRQMIEQVAPTAVPVLLSGETGTGK